MSPTQDVIRKIRKLLNRYVRVGRDISADWAEAEFDFLASEIRKLPREEILTALDEAAGSSKARQKILYYVLAELADVPGALDRIRLELRNSDWRVRFEMISTIGRKKLVPLAPLLNEIMLFDDEDVCRNSAISAASNLKLDVNFGAVLEVAKRNEQNINWDWALKEYACEEGRPYLRRAFDVQVPPQPRLRTIEDVNTQSSLHEVSAWELARSRKTIGAWGLAKLGDKDALAFLGEMLNDPVITTRNSTRPGESLRAAQAIADIFHLPFEWSTDYVPRIREWWELNKHLLLRG